MQPAALSLAIATTAVALASAARAHAITSGRCLVVCRSDGELERGLLRGFAEATELKLTALYPTEDLAAAARERLGRESRGSRIACRVGRVKKLPFPDGSFDLVVGVGPILLQGDREAGMREIHRVLRAGGAALIGGRFTGMPESRRVPSAVLRQSAGRTGIPSIRVLDEGGQWLEIRRGIGERELGDG